MNSRERVRKTLEHKQPDRVPVDLWGSACRIHTDLYRRIAAACGFEGYGEKVRPGTTTEYVDYRISDAVKSDFRHIQIGKPENYQNWVDENGRVIDEWGIGRTQNEKFNGITFFPLSDIDTNQIKTHKWPTAKDPGRIRGLHDQAKNWNDNTNFAITATSAVSGILFELAQYLCGVEEFLIAMHTEPYFVESLLDKLTEIVLDINLYYLEPIGEYIEWIEFTEDFGTQSSLFCSPEMIRQYFRKPHQIIFNTIKKRFPNLKIFFHTCGVVEPIIPELIEWGVDILNPLQPLMGMDMNRIKRTWGDQLAFHGAIDIQGAILGDISDVEREVKTRIEQLACGGGYILAPTNHFQNDVPIDNFFALYDFAQKYGTY